MPQPYFLKAWLFENALHFDFPYDTLWQNDKSGDNDGPASY